MSDSIERFLKSMSENGFSPNTIRAYKSDLVLFRTTYPNFHESQLTLMESLAKDWLQTHRDTWTPRTMKRKASALRAWARFMGDPKFLAEYRLPKPPRPVPHPVAEGVDGVLDMIVESKTPHHRALIALCGLGGLRVHEALAMTRDDIDWNEGTMLVRGKGSKQRIVPMSPLLQSFIRPAAATPGPLVPLSDRAARAFITRCARRAGMANPVASHDLRSTFLTAAYDKTKDLRAVQELAGHASSETTESYTRISMDAMRAAAAI